MSTHSAGTTARARSSTAAAAPRGAKGEYENLKVVLSPEERARMGVEFHRLDPFAAPDAHMLRMVYGDEQLRAALDRYDMGSLRQSAEYHGLGRGGKTRAEVIERIAQHATSVPRSESEAIASENYRSKSAGMPGGRSAEVTTASSGERATRGRSDSSRSARNTRAQGAKAKQSPEQRAHAAKSKQYEAKIAKLTKQLEDLQREYEAHQRAGA